MTVDEAGDSGITGSWESALATALELPSAPPGMTWLARAEWSNPLGLKSPSRLPPRAISVLANDTGGQKRIMVKGRGQFAVRTIADLEDQVAKLRATLDKVAIHGEGQSAEYAFIKPTQERLDAALRDLASRGFALYDACIPAEARSALGQDLAQPGQTIQIAHLLLQNVIPWAAIYDRPYDPRCKKHDGHDIAQVVCHARDATTASACGTSLDCPLHPDNVAALRSRGEAIPIEKTTVCARHFWGFRHVLEVPPLQSEGEEKAGAPPCDSVGVRPAEAATVVAALNSGFAQRAQHLAELSAIVQKHGASLSAVDPCGRDDVIERLEKPGQALVYFYCHASPGDDEEPDPHLAFAVKDTLERITARDLDGRPFSPERPLIILNGCGTVGFSAKGLSPFVIKLVGDRQAAGLVGTEAPIWEELARRFAEKFLDCFLDNQPAGRALLSARQAMLGEGDPMGLVYTLYALAELRMRSDAT
jgi:hypothetical protein